MEKTNRWYAVQSFENRNGNCDLDFGSENYNEALEMAIEEAKNDEMKTSYIVFIDNDESGIDGDIVGEEEIVIDEDEIDGYRIESRTV